jgi:hypothetical protein
MFAREAPVADDPQPTNDGAGAAVELGVFVLVLFAYMYVVGWVTSWLRLSAARLPIDVVASFADRRILGDGLRSTALTAVVFAVLCVLAYVTSARRWEVNGQDWHDIVRKRGVRAARAAPRAELNRARREKAAAKRIAVSRAQRATRLKRLATGGKLGRVAAAAAAPGDEPAAASLRPVPNRARPTPAPIGETGVRIVAGFNVLILAALLASAAAVGFEELFTQAWWASLACWGLVFLALHYVLTRWGPLQWGPYLHGGVWVLIAAVALFASAPLGVLALTGVAISTGGRALGRLARPRSIRGWVRSPLSLVLLSILALIGFAYQAIPPVSFPGVAIATTTGIEQTGGYLTRSNAGVYVATCSQRSDATSTGERVVFVASGAIKTVVLGGQPESFDSGERPSLATLALRALGLHETAPTLVNADLRPRRGTCAGAAPSTPSNGEEAALGVGVLDGPMPARVQAHDGEPPIEQTTPAVVATLARRFQPTLEVTAADRFWPVSVGALLADRGPNGEPACLVQQRPPGEVCEPSLSRLAGAGSTPSDYLQYPAPLLRDPSPEAQFEAFERGQQIEPGPIDRWLTKPQVLNPWYTAQIYFYYAGVLESTKWPKGALNPRVPKRVETLEYWFYYPYNYFPLVVRSDLMLEAPIAADLFNVDFHQGDWEHIDVLLEPGTHVPLWLYMARHSGEGQFVPWASAPLLLDHTHPVVQAAFGGHPTYVPGCGQKRRPKTLNVLSDWLVCGFRFLFAAKSTPLVDVASTPWACWRGHFGEAVPGVEVNNANKPESVLDKLTHQVFVAGPLSPLQQAENTGACDHDPRAPESTLAGSLRPNS